MVRDHLHAPQLDLRTWHPWLLQERRARIGQTLDKKVILRTFVKECVTHGNSGDLATAYSTFCERYVLAV